MQGITLGEVKEEIRRIYPDLEREEELSFQTAVVVLAAAFSTGPNTERLAAFTGYAPGFVAEISKRMHQAGLWVDGMVMTDHWFNGEQWSRVGFWTDTMVGEGLIRTQRRDDGELEYLVRRDADLQ